MSQPLLEIRNIRKNYGSQTVIDNVQFEIYEKQIYSLLGVNGAGKSSLTAILASLHAPCEGEVLWRGLPLLKQLSEYRQFVGFCPQEQTLDASLTLRQSLQFQGKYYGFNKVDAKKTADRLILQFELTDYAESFPYLLSGGYKQRFIIAKTLMHHPRFLILDEPSVGLDSVARKTLWEKIIELKSQGMTVFFTTHYLGEAEKYADYVCVLHQGKLQMIDTPTNLKAKWQRPDLESAFLQLLSGENK